MNINGKRSYILCQYLLELNVQLHASAALYLKKAPQYLPNSRLGEPRSTFHLFEEKKNLLTLSGIEI